MVLQFPASFETDRLYLRSMQLGDEAIMFPEIDEQLTKHWTEWEPPKDMTEQKSRVDEFVRKSEEHRGVYFLAFRKEADEFIGVCDVDPIECSTIHRPWDVWFGIWVKHSAQGQGFAYEIMSDFIEWNKRNTTFPYIVYSYTEGNEPSKRLLEKLGGGEYVGTEIFEKRGEMRRVFDYRINMGR